MESWEKIREELVYDGYRRILRKTFRLPDGREEDFDIITGESTASVLAFTKSNEVILARQFRPGTEGILDELPAGIIENGEEPINTAKREFLEETGYTGKLKYVGSSIEGAYRESKVYCFTATGCEKTNGLEGLDLDKNEFIEVITKPFGQFMEQLRSGKLTDVGSAYMALDYLKLLG